MLWGTLLFSAEVTLPVCLLIFLGWFLKKQQCIDDHFVSTASWLVFHWGMPALLFTSVMNLKADTLLDPDIILFFVIATILGFLSSAWLARSLGVALSDHSAFIQGAARANLAIVGMAFAGNLYSLEGIALVSLLVAFLVPLYNVLSVFVLSYFSGQNREVRFRWPQFWRDLVKNPLIMAIVIAAVCRLIGWDLPNVVDKVGRYMAQITLPLALICIGGSLQLQNFAQTRFSTFWSSAHKIVLMPLIGVPVAWLLGFRGSELGVLFLALSCPTAAASFVMTKTMGGNAGLAANIIAVSTMASMVVTALGVFSLKMMSLI